MTSDSGLASQETDYTREIQEVLDELHQMQQTPRLVTSPEELEELERHIRQGTELVGRVSSAAGLGCTSLTSGARSLREPLAHAAQKRWEGAGKDSHGSRTYSGCMDDVLDIIGFNQSLSSSAHRKQRAGDGKRREDCANHRQSPSPDPKCPRW